jgi:TetR/AcrR family transcriptional regulator, regulator of cefoperazone and chloramphenicol sensitivity
MPVVIIGGVPVDARATRERIMAEAERLFALKGVGGAQIRDIVRAAGQANDSAVHYHFGSRYGLLTAICERQIGRMEPARIRWLDQLREEDRTGDLAALVAALIEPTSELLLAQDGRYFLQIMVQLAGLAGVRDGSAPPALHSTALSEQLSLIHAVCSAQLPDAVVLERITLVIGMLTAALADRANVIDAGSVPLLDHATFTANLEAMIVAALSAPLDQPTVIVN